MTGRRPSRGSVAVQLLIGGVLAGISAGGCGSSDASQPSAGQVAGTDVSAPIARLPLLPVLREEPAFESALGVLMATRTQSCMKLRGFDYETDPAPAVLDFQTDEDVLAARYGAPLSGPDGVLGYPTTEEQPAEVSNDSAPSAAYTAALTGSNNASAELTAVNGESWGETRVSDGCGGVALTDIFGSAEDFIAFSRLRAIVESASSISLDRLTADADDFESTQLWMTCMKSAGFEFGSPFEAQYQSWPQPRPGESERETARADLACRQTSGLHRGLAEAEYDLQTDLMAQHPEAVEDVLAIYADVIAAAKELNDSPP